MRKVTNENHQERLHFSETTTLFPNWRKRSSTQSYLNRYYCNITVDILNLCKLDARVLKNLKDQAIYRKFTEINFEHNSLVALFVTILTTHFVKSRTVSAHRELSPFPKIGIQLGDIYICSSLTSKNCFLFFFVLILNDEHNLHLR